MPDARLKQLLLMLFSSEYDGEMATARNMIVAALKKDGHDIHWLADMVSRGGVSNGGGSADYLKGFRDGTATASTTSRATSSEVQRAFASGQRAGYDAGYKTGFAEAGAVARSRQAPGWTPDWFSDPTVYDGADPEPGSTMPAQAWAAWLLTRRRNHLSKWEQDFCRSIARWRGETTEKQKIHLQDVIRKVRQ